MISIWEKETFYAPQDVIIIGSGFVGLWSALFLKKRNPQLKVTLLERGLIPTGASSRNAGFACFGSLSELVADAKNMGTEKMLQLVKMRFKGLKRIQKYFPKQAIDFELCGGYELYDHAFRTDQLAEDINYLNSLLKPVVKAKKTFRLVDEKIAAFGFGNTLHMVKNEWEGYLHSGKLLQVLLKTVAAMGVQVFTSIEVKEILQQGSRIALQTKAGPDFSAAQVLLCTNAFTRELIPDIDIVPARGQVVLTSPIDGLPWNGTFHSDEGFFYFRNLGNRVLLGGARNKAFEDERTTEMITSEFIQHHLQQYLDEVILPAFRGQYTVEHRWAGIMAMGSEKMPIVQQLQNNVFCAVRMSGMGVALAPVVGEEVARLMQG